MHMCTTIAQVGADVSNCGTLLGKTDHWLHNDSVLCSSGPAQMCKHLLEFATITGGPFMQRTAVQGKRVSGSWTNDVGLQQACDT